MISNIEVLIFQGTNLCVELMTTKLLAVGMVEFQ